MTDPYYRTAVLAGTTADIAAALADLLTRLGEARDPVYEPVWFLDAPQRDALIVVLRRQRRARLPPAGGDRTREATA